MGRRGRKEETEGRMRLDERNGEDRFVRTEADEFQGAKMLRNRLYHEVWSSEVQVCVGVSTAPPGTHVHTKLF